MSANRKECQKMDMRIIGIMVAFVMADATALSAPAVHLLPPFPEAAPPDAEVAVAATLPQMPRNLGKFEVTLDIPQGCTNEVLVAIGTDADSDGNLSDGEIDIVFGFDCGQRYWMRPKNGEYALGTSGADTIPHWDAEGMFVVPKRHWNFGWNMAVALKRGVDGREAAVRWSRTLYGFTIRIS